MEGLNATPQVYAPSAPTRRRPVRACAPGLEGPREVMDALEVFDMIRHLNDPEHPLTLEQLNVASIEGIEVDDARGTVNVRFTPTIPHWCVAGGWGIAAAVDALSPSSRGGLSHSLSLSRGG